MADPFALACKHCGWRPPGDLVMGVAAAHFETEHDTTDVAFDLVVVCDRCDRVMTHLATIGDQHHYECAPCHRGRVIKQGPPANP
jgi:hypothetical protein